MNDRDIAAVLGILAAAWPNQVITEQTAAVWRDLLADVDAADAMAAARVLIRREHWFPSIAQFRNAAEAEAHARRNRDATSHGLPSHRRTPVAPPARLVAATRQLLAEQQAKRHDHNGPAPCPVCGGRKPPTITSPNGDTAA